MRVRNAHSCEHDMILAIAKTSRYTKDFSNRVMFSSDAAYEKGWIKVAESDAGEIIGFTCVRHKTRQPETMLYFITIHPEWRGQGVGKIMLDEVMDDGPHSRMALNVMKDNEAVSFYENLGFERVGEAINGGAWRMEREWPTSN